MLISEMDHLATGASPSPCLYPPLTSVSHVDSLPAPCFNPVAYEGGVSSNYRSVHRGDKHGTATDTIRVTTQFYQRGWRPVGKPDHGASRALTCQRPAENAQELAVESLCPRL